jgi:broad specificity phosphatase PhoE
MQDDQSTYRITLLRHAESEGNRQGIIQGQADYPLTGRGRQQAAALGRRWQQEGRSFDAVISSPLSRARETAEIIASSLGMDIELQPVWMERDFGQLSGRPRAELFNGARPQPYHHPYEPVAETGETILQFFLRGGEALQTLLSRPPGTFLVVSHGGILNMALYAALGIAPQPDFLGPRFSFRNAAFATLLYEPEIRRWQVLTVDDQAHWAEEHRT